VAGPPPSFLDLPERTGKPRRHGLTVVIDGGLPVAEAEALLPQIGPHVDVWKLGWGTAYLDPTVPEKVEMLGAHGVLACTGGTLLEIAARAGRAGECLTWAARTGFPCVEVSDGLREMEPGAKAGLIRRAARDFTVLSEVGAKDAIVRVDPDEWAEEVASDLDAGAAWVIAEGRESGTVGLYDSDGSPRPAIVAAVTAAAGSEAVVFEAPRKDQQAWFIARFGTNVNLANVAPRDVLGLEALRLGLRADTASRLRLPTR
jgi:phosphosulfolactate synthase